MKIKKFLLALILLVPMIASASDNPKGMYDFMPYLGARTPDWIANLNKTESSANKVIKTIDYKESNSDTSYRYTLFDDILYSVEVRVGYFGKDNWSIEDKYTKLGIATGIADSLQANGFAMTANRDDSSVRYFEKNDIFVSLSNYQTQYRKDTQESSIILLFTNNKFNDQVQKQRSDILSRLSIEHKAMYQDLIGK